MKSIVFFSSALSVSCHPTTTSKLSAQKLFVWMFHANQHGYLCNQIHGKPCHNHQKHGRPWNAIFNQARLLRSSGANFPSCESVCPLDLLPSMSICVHILAVEVKTYIFNAFSDISDPFHTEPLPQQPRQGLFPLQQPTEPPQSLCLVRACSPPPAAHRALCYFQCYISKRRKNGNS